MDRQKIERSIKGLSEWQMHVQAESDIDTNISTAIEALKAQLSREGTTSDQHVATETNIGDTISRQVAIDRFNVIRPVDPKKDEYTKGIDVGIAMCVVAVKDQPTIQPVATDTNVGDKISKFIDGLEEIFADLRERHVDDSVCGLCEYDGAYIGQSGDWCNECPGFEKDDCFKLSDKTRKEWTEEIITICKHVGNNSEIPNSSDCISRQQAIDGKIVIQRANGVEIYSDEAVPVEYLKSLPPAQPEPHEGQWVDGRCNKCGGHAPFWCMASTYYESDFCPCCGAKMKGADT